MEEAQFNIRQEFGAVSGYNEKVGIVIIFSTRSQA